MCRTCNDNGVIPVNQFRNRRWFRWVKRKSRRQPRYHEPFAKMQTCPTCQKGGLR